MNGKESTGTPPPHQQDSTGHASETGGIMVGPEEHTEPQGPVEQEDEQEEIGTD